MDNLPPETPSPLPIPAPGAEGVPHETQQEPPEAEPAKSGEAIAKIANEIYEIARMLDSNGGGGEKAAALANKLIATANLIDEIAAARDELTGQLDTEKTGRADDLKKHGEDTESLKKKHADEIELIKTAIRDTLAE